MFLNTGYRARKFADPVTPCSKQSTGGSGPGRMAAAEWLRTSFHDVATANAVKVPPLGGLDASIVYELTRLENVGTGFTSTVTTFEPFFGPRAPMSEIIAIGTYTSVRGCGGPAIPIRLGRVDATVAGDTGVPQPQDGIVTFRNRFARLNMNDAEMVQVTACGHTLGGVHGSNFPQIVADPNGFQAMDSTNAAFDEKIASEYVDDTTTNPLVKGISVQSKRNSDFVVNMADNNATIKTMTNSAVFKSTCQKILQKMIEVVPGGPGKLSTNALTPYEVKPYALQLYLQNGGDSLTFAGDIRVRTTNRPQGSIASVSLIYKDRSGNAGSNTISTTFKDTAGGFDDTFAFFSFSTSLPSSTSISSFTVQISYTNGGSDTFNNNGNGFPVSDTLLLQYPQSCSSNPSSITVTAAVRNTTSGTPNLNFLGRNYNGITIVPKINTTTTTMVSSAPSIGPYTIYNLTIPLNATQSARGHFNITLPGSSSSVDLALLSTLSSTCTPLLASVAANNTTPTTPQKTYTALGCYADLFPSQPRSLSGPFTYSNNMSASLCADFCSTYAYFGTEYASECYCGSALTYNGSLSAGSCNMACSASSSSSSANSEICGGPGALSLYHNDAYAKPTYPSPGTGWSYQGCYTDDVGNRTIQGYRTNDGALTLGKCAAVCDQQGGYAYMGAEYHSECYCGSGIVGTGTQVDDVQCDTVCSGDGKASCGGAGRVSVYVKALNASSSSSNKERRWVA